MIRVDVVQAWPRRFASRSVQLPEGATVADALDAAGHPSCKAAVFGERADPERVLADGDRVEILRPLLADPKDTRRRRAAGNTS
jgi:putative ubiquitin-RnfH superfamily antitoxin RatB of RatAB toxin-antitoxin module